VSISRTLIKVKSELVVVVVVVTSVEASRAVRTYIWAAPRC